MRHVLTIIFFGLAFSHNAIAQADLNIFGTAVPIGMGERGMNFTVRNNGISNSDPFRIKVWVSIDPFINDLDRNSTSGLNPSIRPYDPANRIFDSRSHTARFSFPLPMQEPVNELLVGDTRRPAAWLGEQIWVRGCIAADGINFDECQEFSRSVAPPRVRQTVSSGLSRDFIELKWPPIKPDGALPMVDEYRITEFPYSGSTRQFNVNPDDIPVVMDDDGVTRHRYIINDIDPGKSYSYRVESCHINAVAARICAPVGAPRGNALADFSASRTGEDKGIRVDWFEFAPNWPGYELERCIVGSEDDCVTIRRKGIATSYLDLDVMRGVDYVYTVKACQSYTSSNDPERCTSQLWTAGVTNAGTSGLVDDYEDDDSAAQATTVRARVAQLRSFDTADDEDWVRIVSLKPQKLTIRTSGNTFNDTEITVFDANLLQIDYNDNPENAETAYASLTTAMLPAGDYFVKINQRFTPLPPLYRPVANYVLEVDLKSIVLSPVLDLFLGEDSGSVQSTQVDMTLPNGYSN